MPVYVYYFAIIPLAVVAGILLTRWQKKMALKRAAEVGVGRLVHESFSHMFQMNPGEELVRFWGGLIYSGDLVPEYKDRTLDKVGRAANVALNALVGTTVVYHTGRVLVGLTSHARVLVLRDDDKFHARHYAAYTPGAPIYMACDFPEQDPGKPSKEVLRFARENKKVSGKAAMIWKFLRKQMKNDKLAAPEMPRMHVPVPTPGVSDDIGFVLFGRDEGARMPAWMTGDVVDILMRWRRDPAGTVAELIAAQGPQGQATKQVTGEHAVVPMRAPSLA